jgi:hypothetical protein
LVAVEVRGGATTDDGEKPTMSEYQYYEFLAIDRRLTEKEMQKLRSCSTRATITPTRFVNEYEWGDFKGDEDAWVQNYFDAFLYFANWGTHVLKLALPARLLNLQTARLYCVGDCAAARAKDGKLIITLTSDEEDLDDDEDGEGLLASLVAIREELARGDLRGLYLGWLLCAQRGELDEEDLEPPVPAGLAQLSASQQRLAEFLRSDADLLQAAAKASSPKEDWYPKPAEFGVWLATMDGAEKDALLARLIAGNEPELGAELLQRVARARKGERPVRDETGPRRSVGELLEQAREIATARERHDAEERARQRATKERAAAKAKAKHLDGIEGTEPFLWSEVARLIATKLPKNYDRAIVLLTDLRGKLEQISGHASKHFTVNMPASLR